MNTQCHELARTLGRALMAAVVASAAAGCDRAVGKGESQIWGTVTVRGRPLTEGTVILKPVVDREATWGAGPLDEQGRFHVAGSRPDVPFLPGRYFVYVRPPAWALPGPDEAEARAAYPVPARFLDAESPAIQVEIKDEPMMLDLKLDE